MVKLKGVKLGNPNPAMAVQKMNEGARKARIEFYKTIIPIINDIKLAGIQTLQGICDCLNRRGIATRTGKGIWNPSQVRNIILAA